jgi:putative hydrolase of the HAD superfamily
VNTRPIQFVLFDAVGTLIRPDPAVADIYRRVALRFGVDLGAAEIDRRFSEAFRSEDSRDAHQFEYRTSESRELERWQAIVEHVFAESDRRAEIFGELWQAFGRAETWRSFDDVSPAISALKKRGLPLGVASNFDRRLRTVAAGLPELAAIKRFFISSEIGFRKPSPAFFQAIERELGLPPEAIFLVGDDQENDVEAARACGWQAALVDRSKGDSLTAALAGWGLLEKGHV